MALTIGIIGLPQSGKQTTLFNALNPKQEAPISATQTALYRLTWLSYRYRTNVWSRLQKYSIQRRLHMQTVICGCRGYRSGAHTATERREGLSAEFSGTHTQMPMPSLSCYVHLRTAMFHIFMTILIPTGTLDSLNAELALTDLATVERAYRAQY